MMTAKAGKEIVLTVRNEIGVLANLAKALADKGINILAASAWVQGENGVIHLVTDDNLRATETLRPKGYQPRESDVVLTEVPHKPGMLRHLTESLAKEGVDIHHLYATAAAEAGNCLIVFSSANNDRAIVLLNR